MWAVREIYGSVVQKLITDPRLNMDPLRPILCKFHFKIVQPSLDNKLGKLLHDAATFPTFLCNIRFKDFTQLSS